MMQPNDTIVYAELDVHARVPKDEKRAKTSGDQSGKAQYEKTHYDTVNFDYKKDFFAKEKDWNSESD